MGYSTNKPYQRTTYRAPTDGSYDRYLKSGTLVGNKESMLEKPYKVSTYAQMQQDFNIPIPPSFDWGDLPVIPGMDLPPPPGDVIPIGGTGGLTCYWTSTGCEQLVGCWAGSDLVLDGPEAATAGYLPPSVSEGEIVQTTISGSENRGIDFVLNPLVPRNTFTVSFKDANGVIASQTIDITCSTLPTYYTDTLPSCFGGNRAVMVSDSSGYIHFFTDGYIDPDRKIAHIVWNGLEYSCSLLDDAALLPEACIDNSDNIYVSYFDFSSYTESMIRVASYNGSSWNYTTVKDFGTEVYGGYGGPIISLDSSGYLHIIESIYGDRIYHYTNSSGSWQEEAITGVLTGDLNFDYYIDGTTIHLAYWYRASGISYLEYIYGSWGSWSAPSTIKSGVGSYDQISFVKTTDGNKHIITTYGVCCYEYIYTDEWNEILMYSSTIQNRSPHAIAVGNTLYACILVSLYGDYYPYLLEKTTSWAVISTAIAGNQTPMRPFVLYDDVTGLLHILQSNQHTYVLI